MTGRLGATDKAWTESGTITCNDKAHLYGFEL